MRIDDKTGIIVIGSANSDLVIRTSKPPRMGETVVGDGFMTTYGGKGANQAVSAARLGASVTFVGAVGRDVYGDAIIANLSANGVDVSMLTVVDGCPTGTAVIVVYEGDNFIVLDAGANGLVGKGHVDAAETAIASADTLILQCEIPIETVIYAMETAKKYNTRVILNPAPAGRIDADVLTLADCVTPNESECEALTGIPINSVDDARQAAAALLGKGVRHSVITLGGLGAVCCYDGDIRHVPAVKVERVVDTTAAGDSFTAGLAVALTEGKSPVEAVAFANAVASVTVGREGAQPSLPFRRDVR